MNDAAWRADIGRRAFNDCAESRERHAESRHELRCVRKFATVKRDTGRTVAPPHGQGAPFSVKTQFWLLQTIMLPTITRET